MKFSSAILATVPIIWLLVIAGLLNLYETRETLKEFQIEHANVQAGLTQGSDSLSDLFEYKATAAIQYADVIETFLILGCTPALLFYLALVLIRRRRSENNGLSTKFREELT